MTERLVRRHVSRASSRDGVMFALNVHRAGLRSVIAVCFAEMHTGARLQTVEIRIEYTVTVEINFAAIGGLDDPEILFRIEFEYLPMRFGAMLFHFAMKTPVIVFQLSACGIKGIPDCNINILVGMVIIRLT